MLHLFFDWISESRFSAMEYQYDLKREYSLNLNLQNVLEIQ